MIRSRHRSPRSTHRRWGLGLALGLLAGAAVPAGAATELQGYYESNFTGSRADETWQVDRPRHFFELRLLSAPWAGTEAFIKTYAESNRFANRDDVSRHEPRLFFAEAHVKLRSDHTELLFTSKQNRFWFSQPLLQVVDGNKLGGSRAIRLDFWDTYGFQGLAYYGDQTTTDFGNDADDFVVTRITRPSLDRRLQFGATFGRLDFGSSTSEYDMTAAADVELALGELVPGVGRLGRTTLVVEAGRNLSGGLDDADDLNAVEGELRDVRIQNLTLKLNGWYRERNAFTGRLSSRGGFDDRKGTFVEAYYRLPRKQLDLRYTYLYERGIKERFFGDDGNDLFSQDAHALELYAELKGGFSAWVKYRHDENNARTEFQDRDDIVFELQGQNKLISVRPQVRFRNVGLPFAVQGYGMEINFNATDNWKFFSRFLNAEENTESRRTIFVSAQYRGFQDAEFFIEYGDGGRSDRLTENDGFISEGPSAVDQDSERRVQVIFKYWF